MVSVLPFQNLIFGVWESWRSSDICINHFFLLFLIFFLNLFIYLFIYYIQFLVVCELYYPGDFMLFIYLFIFVVFVCNLTNCIFFFLSVMLSCTQQWSGICNGNLGKPAHECLKTEMVKMKWSNNNNQNHTHTKKTNKLNTREENIITIKKWGIFFSRYTLSLNFSRRKSVSQDRSRKTEGNVGDPSSFPVFEIMLLSMRQLHNFYFSLFEAFRNR